MDKLKEFQVMRKRYGMTYKYISEQLSMTYVGVRKALMPSVKVTPRWAISMLVADKLNSKTKKTYVYNNSNFLAYLEDKEVSPEELMKKLRVQKSNFYKQTSMSYAPRWAVSMLMIENLKNTPKPKAKKNIEKVL